MSSACDLSHKSSSCSLPKQNGRHTVKSKSLSRIVAAKVVNSISVNKSQNRSRNTRRAAPHPSNNHQMSQKIFKQPPLSYSKIPPIPPFPGVLPTSPNEFCAVSQVDQVQPSTPFQEETYISPEFMMSPPPPPYLHPALFYLLDHSSKGYRLMKYAPYGYRDDGTYGVLDFVPQNQEYRMHLIYANSVVYYALNPYIPVVNRPPISQ